VERELWHFEGWDQKDLKRIEEECRRKVLELFEEAMIAPEWMESSGLSPLPQETRADRDLSREKAKIAG